MPADTEKSSFTYRQLAQLAKYSPDTPLRVIAHIDLDAFYAQVETKRLSLPADEPLAVQQWQNLIAVNYAARAHSVTRHEPAADALKRCPQLRLVHVATWRAGDMHWAYHASPSIATHKACLDPYRIESRKILALFRSACPRVEKASIDESFLDLSAMVHAELVRRWPVLLEGGGDPAGMLPLPAVGARGVGWAGSCVLEKEGGEEAAVVDWDDVAMGVAAEIVAAVRERVRVEIGYTCSAGIAGNKMLAKLGSGYKKPNSQTVVRPGAAQKFLNTLEFTKIRNLGGKLGTHISTAFHTSSLRALSALPLSALSAKLPPDDAAWLYNTIRGVDRSDVSPRTQLKSMLSAKSFRPPLTAAAQVALWLRVFVADIHARLVDEGAEGGGGRRPTVMTMMHRAVGAGAAGKTRQGPVKGGAGGGVTAAGLLAVAEALWGGVVKEGGAFPCAGLSVQVGGFEEREGGNRGIAGFLVKRRVAGEEEGGGSGAKRRRGGEEEDEVVEGGLEQEEEAFVLQRPSPPPADPNLSVQEQSADSDHTPPAPPPPPEETYTYVCPRCAAPTPLQDQAEHEDWHFAKSLAEQDRAAARAAARGSPPPPPPPPPPQSKKGAKKRGGGGLEKGQRKLAFGKG